MEGDFTDAIIPVIQIAPRIGCVEVVEDNGLQCARGAMRDGICLSRSITLQQTEHDRLAKGNPGSLYSELVLSRSGANPLRTRRQSMIPLHNRRLSARGCHPDTD